MFCEQERIGRCAMGQQWRFFAILAWHVRERKDEEAARSADSIQNSTGLGLLVARGKATVRVLRVVFLLEWRLKQGAYFRD